MFSDSSRGKPYKVMLDRRDDWDVAWSIVEQPTGLIVARHYDDARTAKQQANNLNGGLGFRGWTPEYFLQRIEQ